jgi:hypothetical protein
MFRGWEKFAERAYRDLAAPPVQTAPSSTSPTTTYSVSPSERVAAAAAGEVSEDDPHHGIQHAEDATAPWLAESDEDDGEEHLEVFEEH